MVQTKKGGETLRQTNIEKYGSYEAYREHMRSMASKGGSKTGIAKGFALDKDRARRCGALGGRISRRTKKAANE